MKTDPEQSPADLGYTMPPEWAPQEAVWLSWPDNPETWPGRRAAADAAFAEFAAVISRFEQVRILGGSTRSEEHLELMARKGGRLDRISFETIPTNDAWCRDHGPTFLLHPQKGLAAVDWIYNAWGGKFPPWERDDAVPSALANLLNIPNFRRDLVCEGGALEVNGAGVLLTTRSVLLNANRNPGWNESRVEQELKRALGVHTVWWLDSGMAGDDTDGHIDTLTRFFSECGVITVLEHDSFSPNFSPLRRNFEELQRFRTARGEALHIVKLPLPDPIRPEGWREEVLPATHANFLIINGAVLVPTYQQDKKDREALRIIGDCFPGREVIGIDCFDIVLEGGALHCLSQQQPSAM